MRSFFRHKFETRSFPRSLAAIRLGFGLKSITTLQTMTFRNALIISLVFTSAASFGGETQKSSPEGFIRSLYRFHQPGKDTPHWFADKRTLSKYFDKELTTLFIKDDDARKGNRVFAISISTQFTTRKISKKRLTFKLLQWLVSLTCSK